ASSSIALTPAWSAGRGRSLQSEAEFAGKVAAAPATHASTLNSRSGQDMFKGKTALVTGSTSGIGLGIATTLAQRGANVVLNGFGEAAAIERLREGLMKENNVVVRYDAADLTREEAIAGMMQRALGEFGAVDILVNNAGIQHVAPIDEFPVEKWNQILAL